MEEHEFTWHRIATRKEEKQEAETIEADENKNERMKKITITMTTSKILQQITKQTEKETKNKVR